MHARIPTHIRAHILTPNKHISIFHDSEVCKHSPLLRDRNIVKKSYVVARMKENSK
jgi:hypothetical protein